MLNASDQAEWAPLDHAAAGSVLDTPARKAPASTNFAAQLQNVWLQIMLCVIAALPLVWPQMPPLTDLGGHLGRFAVQLDAGASASLREWYSFHWSIIPNLGTDLLMQALAPHMGLEPALKAIVIAIVVIQAGGFLMLARVVHGHVPPTALLALPLVYSYPFQYGFLNFTLGMALGTWALALWIGLDKPGLGRRRWLTFVPIAAALWVCHLEGWALFCILAAGIELAGWRDRGLGWSAVLLRSAAPLSCLALPCLMFAFGAHAAGPAGQTTGWFDLIDKFGMVVMALRDRWGIWDVASALLLVGTIAWTWRARTFSRHSGLVLGAIMVAAAFLILPRHAGGTSFVDMRLMPMILATALIAVRPRDDCPRAIVEALAIVALVFLGARFAGNALSMAIFDKQFTQDLAVLDAVPRDTLLVSMTLKPCVENDPWIRERRTHLAGYALARRHDFSNDQWAMPGGQLLRIHAPAMGSFAGDPSETGSLGACRGHLSLSDQVMSVPPAVNHLWIVENGVAQSLAGWHPIRQSPGSVLYARDL